MLDKKRIRLMVKMSAYEKKNANEDLKISSYYRKDYASLNTLTTVLWITVGYVILAGLYALCNLNTLLENLTIIKLLLMAAIAVGIYLILIIIYCVFAGNFYKKKYNKAKQRVKKYYRDLARLGKMEMKEKK